VISPAASGLVLVRSTCQGIKECTKTQQVLNLGQRNAVHTPTTFCWHTTAAIRPIRLAGADGNGNSRCVPQLPAKHGHARGCVKVGAVHATLRSMSRSHMSLMVHPAPRITTAPSANLESRSRSGNPAAGATIAMLQQPGHSSSQVPMGLSARARRKYGWYPAGIASTQVGRGSERTGIGSRPRGIGILASRATAISGPLRPHSPLRVSSQALWGRARSMCESPAASLPAGPRRALGAQPSPAPTTVSGSLAAADGRAAASTVARHSGRCNKAQEALLAQMRQGVAGDSTWSIEPRCAVVHSRCCFKDGLHALCSALVHILSIMESRVSTNSAFISLEMNAWSSHEDAWWWALWTPGSMSGGAAASSQPPDGKIGEHFPFICARCAAPVMASVGPQGNQATRTRGSP
jgi:hypothetical protein